MKIAVSGESLGRALPSTWNSSINYFRPVIVKTETFALEEDLVSPEHIGTKNNK